MKTKQLVLCALFCALTVIFSQIVIPTVPVQFSLSVVPVLMCGFVLEPKYAFLSQISYLFLGICGLPVLGKFMGGAGALFGPTGGYVLSYPLMSVICSFTVQKIKPKNVIWSFVCQILPMLVCYICGSVYLAYTTDISLYTAFFTGVVPFVLFDILKMILCAVCAKILKKHNI